MVVTRTLLAAALAGTALAGLPAHAGTKKIVQVGSCVARVPSYKSINDAITAVPAGYTIDICPGTYAEQITVGKTLTLQGVDTGAKTNSGSSGAVITLPSPYVVNATDLDGAQPIVAQLVATGGTVTVSNLTFDASGGVFGDCSTNLVGVLYQNASGAIQNSAVLNDTLGAGLTGCQNGLGIYAETSGKGQSLLAITGNYVEGFDKNGVTVNDPGVVATIANNVVLGGGARDDVAQNSVQQGFGASAAITGNLIGYDVYTPADYDGSGVIVYDASPSNVSNNAIQSAQLAVAVAYDTGSLNSNKPTVGSNVITDSVDGVYLGGVAGATISDNEIDGSSYAAIELDASSGNPTSASAIDGNRINSACAGILQGSGSTITEKSNNIFLSVATNILAGGDCTSSGPFARRQAVRHVSVRR